MMPEMARAREERSLGDLFGDLTRELTTLVRQEAELAKTEIGQKASQVSKNVGMLAAGGAVAYAGFLAILGAVVAMLAEAGLPWWASALIVGVAVAGAGAFMAWKGLEALRNADLTPRETIESLKGS
jgi:VIT1/CCC1 family predicted Fe2+/Mn2+ transporter